MLASTSLTPLSFRCSTCKSTSENPRNLVVFIDGTSNKPGNKKTNVVKLQNGVESPTTDSELTQLECYLEGIGAYRTANLSKLGRAWKAIYSSFEMAFALNAEKNVKHAYTWLAENYRQGDQIYLFGFSRGAYQVRSLASMIHELGLVKKVLDVNLAYDLYRSIKPYKAKTREEAIEFKKVSCWSVRIHFIGVWDTVSSLGLIKGDVHITKSASVTNACHFRHALALDERRVKFIPEYFLEVNAHCGHVRGPREPVSDVKEVWFAGSHSDVGGTSRPHADAALRSMDNDPYPVHAGNVPLLWMRQEAAAEGLVLKPEEFTWGPVDVDFGRKDTMKWKWKCLEFFPIHHQVSFSGTGKHGLRWHRSQPRSVIPQHNIHPSVLSGDVYTPCATLGNGVYIPTVPREALGTLCITEPSDEGATTRSLTSLLGNQRKTLGSLEKVLYLLNPRLGNEQVQTIPVPQWLETSVRNETGFAQFVLTIIYDVITGFTVPNDLVHDARNSLSTTLSSTDQSSFPKPFDVLRFSSRDNRLRQRFIAHDNVIEALMHALDQTAQILNEISFQLVVDTLCHLIEHDDARDKVITQLCARPGERLSLALDVKAPHQLASLKLITSSAQYLSSADLRQQLATKITKLAEKERGPVGSATVEALVALEAPLTSNVPILNVLGYLGNTLPRLDVEVGSTSSPDNTGDLELPPVLKVNGSAELDRQLMRKLVSTIQSRDAHERTLATLTVLKLSRNLEIRNFCSEEVIRTFVRQLERKETSLLAAYAFKSCLDRAMVDPRDFGCAAQFIVTMLHKGWFDDAVGRIEGFDIFRGLMTYDNLRDSVMSHDIVTALIKKIEGGERHEVRMSLICLDILGSLNPADLTPHVQESIESLSVNDKKTWKRGVKLLSALAQTEAGEKAIEPRVIDIVKMLHPPQGGRALPRSQIPGPSAALYDLCKNETLRQRIQRSPEIAKVVDLRRQRLLP